MPRLLIITLAALLLIGGAAWFYLAGPNRLSGAELVPSRTLAFAAIPNGTLLAASYEFSNLRKVLESKNFQPLLAPLAGSFGRSNLELLRDFAPNLSGQSFVAVTDLDPLRPAEATVIAGLRPKPGFDRFNDWVSELRADFPESFRGGTLATSSIQGVPVQTIEGQNGTDKIFVARKGGWIVTATTEAGLRDWIEREQGRPSSPSLAEDAAYQAAWPRFGPGAQAFAYLAGSALTTLYAALPGRDPEVAAYLQQAYAGLGSAAVGAHFAGGDLVDRVAIAFPESERRAAGSCITASCPFDTLKFTTPETRLYFAQGIDWPTYWQSNLAISQRVHRPNLVTDRLQSWATDHSLDPAKNLFNALGREVSLQVDWSDDAALPEVGVLATIAQPDDFHPFYAALVDWMRDYAAAQQAGTVSSETLNGAEVTSLEPAQGFTSPTITDDGHFFGLFLLKTQAVRCLQQSGPTVADNPGFARQIGAGRSGASGLVFLNTPPILDHAFNLARPYLPLLALAGLHTRGLPKDVRWLHPMDSWSAVWKVDPAGLQAYSISGVGNQGLFDLALLAPIGRFLSPYLGTLGAGLPAIPTLSSPTDPANSPAASPPNLYVAPPAGVAPLPPPGH